MESRLTYDEVYNLIQDETYAPSSAVLYKLLNCMPTETITGAEIGVFCGRNAKFLMDNCEKIKKMYLVDPWNESVDSDVTISQVDADKNMKITQDTLKMYKNKYEIIRDYSVNASKKVPDNSLDYIFIDGLHDYESVKADIQAWYNKVKDFGIIYGHDFEQGGVKQAVDEIAGTLDKGLYTIMPGGCWMIVKNASQDLISYYVNACVDGGTLVCTPMYNSIAHMEYCKNVAELMQSGMNVDFFWMGNESLITRARNICLSRFYHNKRYDRLLWLDADVRVGLSDLKKLINSDKDVIAAPVMLKNKDKKEFSIHAILGEEDGLMIVDRVATGCLSFSRKAVNDLICYAEKHGDKYTNHLWGHEGEPKYIHDVFKIGVNKELPLDQREYLSEDYWVCDILRELGYKIYVDPSILTTHHGNMAFNPKDFD